MLAALARGLEGGKWPGLVDKAASGRTPVPARGKVRANAGACGVDGITAGRSAKGSRKRLHAVKGQPGAGSCQPGPAKRAWIPKPGGAEKRPSGIPTVTGRVVRAALGMVIGPISGSRFHPQGYGFRPGRGRKEGPRRVEGLPGAGNTHVVEADIKGCFDTIPHGRPMAPARGRIAGGRVPGMAGGFPGQGVMEAGGSAGAAGPMPGGGPQGTPRGGVTGPLPADVCLDPLEWMMAAPGFEMVRCADDMAVPCRSRQQAGVAPEKLREWMEGAGPALHPDKTRVVDMEPAGGRFGFPGCRFRRIRRGELVRLARPGSPRGLRESIKPRTYRANGRSMEAIVADLDRTPSGRSACFKHVEAGGPGGLDGWIRMRLRPIPGKRRGLKGRGRGLDHHRRPNRCFTEPGPFRLPDARAAAVASPHHGANHWPESRMRETRTSGSEGGAGQANAPSLPLSKCVAAMDWAET